MNKLRLLAMLVALPGIGIFVRSASPKVYTLEEIFQYAESNSVLLRPYYAAELEAAKDVKLAKSNRLPDLNANMSVGYNGDGFTTKRDYSDYQPAPIPHLATGLGLTLYQPLYAGGAIKTGIELAELKTSSARFATELQNDNIRFQLAGFYLDIYKYRNIREVVESNCRLARIVLGDMQARHEQGTVLQNDITRYELLLSNYELQLLQIDNTLEILNYHLCVTAGLPEGTTVLPDSTLLETILPVNGEDWWRQEAMINSPSLKSASVGVRISHKSEEIVKAGRFPHIGIKAGWTMDGPILVEVPPINRNLSYWYVGLGVSYDISSLYKTGKAIDKQRAATRKAELERDAIEENISLEIRKDHVRYLEAYETLKTRQKSIELAESNYNVTYTRYINDMALITDMLDAANARLTADIELVNARINIIYNYYKLLFTSGKI